jgi:hypothetical protein
MDCRTARTLIDFDRPNASELEPRDVQDLADHLNRCAECGTAANAERGLDRGLGRAMREVDVPEQLHKHIVARLDAERGEWYRRRIGYAVTATAAAALVLLGVLGFNHWFGGGPATVDFERLCGEVADARLSPTVEKVQEELRRLDVDAPVPTDLRYIYLAAPPALANLPVAGRAGGAVKQVPVLVFVHPRAADVARERVWVYLLDARQFDFKKLPASFTSSDSYHYRVAVVRQDEHHAYLVLHTGDSWDWLRARANDESAE